jgi:molecular chaperone GrpE (heat shock protein)
MNDEALPQSPVADGARPREQQTLGASTLYKLCEEIISLRERNNRQHTEFERRLNAMRDELKTSFDSFAKATQDAYQKLRTDIQGEKRASLALLNLLMEINEDLLSIVAAKPPGDDAEGLSRWAAGVDVESRKVQDMLVRYGIHVYNAKPGAPYNPAMHERVGSRRVEGMGPLLVAEEVHPGYASQQPEFVLRRPKVIVSE